MTKKVSSKMIIIIALMNVFSHVIGERSFYTDEYLKDKKLMPNFQKHSMKTPVKPYLRSSVLEEINSIPTYFILKAQKPTTEPQILYEDDDQINTSFYGTKNTDNRTPKSMVSQNNKEYSSSPTDYQLPTRVPSNYEATKPIQTALSSYQPQQEIIPEYSSHTNEASNGNSQEIDSSNKSYYNQNPTPTKTQSNYQSIKKKNPLPTSYHPKQRSQQETIPEYSSHTNEATYDNSNQIDLSANSYFNQNSDLTPAIASSNYQTINPTEPVPSPYKQKYQPQQKIIPEYSSHTNEASNGNSQEIDSSTNSYYNQNPTPTKTQSNYQTIKHQEIISIPTKPQVSSYQLKQEKIPEYPSNAYEMRNSQPVLTGNQMKKNTYNQIKKIITNGNDKYNVIPESKDKPDLPVSYYKGTNPDKKSQYVEHKKDLNKPIYSDTIPPSNHKQQKYIPKAQPKSTLGTYDLSKYGKLKDTCKIGTIEPLFSGDDIIETYCRCPTGTYGFTCLENIHNPCYYSNNIQQYYAADSSLSEQYFLECNWNIPYLFKCPSDLIWNQSIKSCDYPYIYRAPKVKDEQVESNKADPTTSSIYNTYSKPVTYGY